MIAAGIGIILLIGIVKKNAIMMIDFAIAGGAFEEKTVAAGREFPGGGVALPADHDDHAGGDAGRAAPGLAAIGTGVGGELRQPFGGDDRGWAAVFAGADALY